MTDQNRLSIQPVWGSNRKLSYGVLDAAENILQNIDELSDVLDQLTEKYDEAQTCTKVSTNDEQNGNNEDVNDNEDGDDDDTGITILVNDLKPTNGTESNDTGITILVNDEIPTNPEPAQKLDNERPGLHMFRKLKTCLDSTRLLIGSLRREKGRLMKREMSVECRLSEIEDYKTHMKQDLSSLNDLVDLLSARVMQLEDKLVDEQERNEKLQADLDVLTDRADRAESLCKDLNEDNDGLLNEIRSLKLERKDNTYKIDALIEENHKLKELVREQCESDSGVSSNSESGDGKPHSDTDSELSYDLGLALLSEFTEEQTFNCETTYLEKF